jgi:hypothetical protein
MEQVGTESGVSSGERRGQETTEKKRMKEERRI